MGYVQYSSIIPAPVEELFEYLRDYSNLAKIMPEGIEMHFTGPCLRMQKGAEYEFKIKRFGVSTPWIMRITEYIENELITEKQILGTFEKWNHSYRFEPHSPEETQLTNILEYTIPMGLVGRLLDDLIVRRDLKHIFEVGHSKLRKHFQ